MAIFTESEDAAERFVREYILDAVKRAPEFEGCEGLAFSLNEPQNPDGGSIGLSILGEADAFLRAEEPTWEEYKQDGIIQDWTVKQQLS